VVGENVAKDGAFAEAKIAQAVVLAKSWDTQRKTVGCITPRMAPFQRELLKSTYFFSRVLRRNLVETCPAHEEEGRLTKRPAAEP
jgi:hypothetical protein